MTPAENTTISNNTLIAAGDAMQTLSRIASDCFAEISEQGVVAISHPQVNADDGTPLVSMLIGVGPDGAMVIQKLAAMMLATPEYVRFLEVIREEEPDPERN